MFNSGILGKRSKDTTGIVSVRDNFNQQNYPTPTITSFSVTDASYIPLDDTAIDTAGGQTIVLNGYGFAPGITVMVNSSNISVVTYIDPNRISFTAPALSSGSYTVYATNVNGGTAILVPGLVYSGIPTFTTSAGSLGSYYETTSINTSVSATGDTPITYSVVSGSLPSGATLSSNGTLSGTAPADYSSSTYSFVIQASDAENQDTIRSFNLTINTDVVSFSTPANNVTYNVIGNSPISNVTASATSAAGYGVLYSSTGLPTGLTIDAGTGVISGTPTVEASNNSIITATANTTTRSSTLYINWVVSLGDLYWKQTSLLLNGETPVTPYISDASANNVALTVVGNPVPTKFNPYQNGYYSNYFDGTGDYLTAASSTAFQLGTGDYTFEAWIYPTALGSNNSNNILNIGTYITGLLIRSAATTGIEIYTNNTQRLLTATGLTQNAWQHIALVRNGSACTFYVNGTSIGTFTDSSSISPATATVTIGMAAHNSSEFFTGYMSNYRLVKGTAVYTSAFTPSTSPLTAISGTSLLTCQSNRLIDKSSNAFTITKNGDTSVTQVQPFTVSNDYTGVYFPSTSDYSTFTGTTAQVFGTGDFTVECWVYATNTGTTTGHNISRPSTLTNTWSLQTYNNALNWLFGSTTLGTGAVPVYAWSHLCVSRVSGVTKGFVNGTQTFSVADTNNYSASPTRPIGSGGGGSAVFYVSDFRVVVGSGVTSVTVPTSPLTAITNTQLLTHQYSGAVVNQTIIDNGQFNNIITRNGNASQGTFSPYSQTGWSNFFDGSGDYIDVTGIPVAATGQFTVEAWIYTNKVNSSTNQMIYSQYNTTDSNRFTININTSNKLTVTHPSGNITGATTITPYQWNHIAVTRDASNTLRIFLNGVVDASSSSWTNSIFQTNARIGYYPNTPLDYFNGYISNLRVLSGTGLYTEAFTLPTTALTAIANTTLLTCGSNRFVDNSNNNYTLTRTGDVSVQPFSPFGGTAYNPSLHGGSVYFDGSGDYLTIPTSTNFGFGSGDFTVEFWVYPTATTRQDWIDITDGTNRVLVYYSGSAITFYSVPTNAAAITGPAIVARQWYHIALSKSSGSSRLFVNGVQVGATYATNQTYSATMPITIGKDSAGSTHVTGYISDIRITKGLGIYTANTSVPTTPATNYSTSRPASLLLNMNNGGITDKHSSHTFETVGNAQLSTAVKKYGSASMYFDGNGDRLVIPYSTLFSQMQPYTVEFWFYPTNNGVTGQYIFARNSGGFFNLNWFGTIMRVDKQGTGIQITGSTTMAVNQWHHFAMTYDGTNTKIWVNGVLDGSVAGTSTSDTSANITIGYYEASGTSSYYGYIDDFKFTKGVALYTSNFTPPTQLLTS